MTAPVPDLNAALRDGIGRIHNVSTFVRYEGGDRVFVALQGEPSRHGRECLLLLGDPLPQYSNAVLVPPEMFEQLVLTYAPSFLMPGILAA